MSAEVKSALESEVRAWTEKNPEEAPPPPAPTPNVNGSSAPASEQPKASPPPGPSSLGASPTSSEQDDDDEPELTAAQAAELFVALLDAAATNFVGKRMELTPKQEAKLVKLATPLAEKYLPEAGEIASPETAFIVGAAVIYLPKYLSPEPAKAPAPSAGGGGDKSGSSGGLHTEANVDGRTVNAEVLQ